MGIIALLTDFGTKDSYVAAMKGVILSINPLLQLIDITHNIDQGDVEDAAFLLNKSYSFFPSETIFLVVVDPTVGSRRRALLIKTANYFFIGPDNGVLSLAAKDDGIREIIELTNKDFFRLPLSLTFHGRDIFAPVSAYLSKKTLISEFGRPLLRINEIISPMIEVSGNVLKGKVRYIDTFGNLVTNIEKEALHQFLNGRPFAATLKNRKIRAFYKCYAMAENDEPFFVEGGFSLIEVSLKNSSAREFFKAEKDAEIIIKIAKDR